MTYPVDFESKLGFDQIRNMIRQYCVSPASLRWVDDIRFSTSFNHIRTALLRSLEFKMILEKAEDFPLCYFPDPTEWFGKIALEGNYLEAQEMLEIANAMQTILAGKSFLTKSQETYPELFQLSQPVTLSGQLSQRILAIVDDTATVKDSASPELGRIRKRLRDKQSEIRRLSDQLYKKAVAEKWVPEGALPTIREGRVVIPVLAEHKRKLRGFILDESATGQTVFMEPAEMLDANNEIRDLEHAERREVIRILKELTAMLREHLPVIEQAFDFLTQLDCIRATARMAVELNCDLPVMEDKPALTWYNAKHPLLSLSLKGKRDVVPLQLELNDDDRMILVSGPNAGGKSVCLKTVGLLQYMFQCGLLVPLSDRSRMGVFQEIFLDIGDQQSIENDLSTYSSHLRNMSFFMTNCTEKSLILIDEFGSGTDPNFGGAIAQAILASLLKRKVWGIATTHYYNLKLFAGQHAGIRNGAMRFDEKNLVPLYTLDIGKPGSSFALEIAGNTGLPGHVLAEAKELAGKELAGFETLMRDVEKERQELALRIKQLEQREQEVQHLLEEYEVLNTELNERKKLIIDKAKQEAQQLLKETNREIEKTIRHIRENRAERKETSKVRKGLQDLSKKVTSTEHKKPRPAEPLKEGDRVRILGQEGSGVIQVIKGKNAVVQFGELKSVVKLTMLEKAATGVAVKEAATPQRSSGLNVYQKRMDFQPVLDVRGKRAEEVAPLLDQFLDTALLLGQGELKILHGKGEGVLRKVVREQLRRYKEVESVQDEHVERGGEGITVVVLK